MKKVILGILVLSVLTTFTTISFAADKKKAAPAVVAPTVLQTLSGTEIKSKEQEALGILNSRVWTVYLKLHGGKKPVVITDVLTFTGTGVVSQYLTGQGFKGSAYSLSIQPQEGYAIWETVQEGLGGASAAWRGELLGDLLRGTVLIKNSKGIFERYDFSTNVPKDMPLQEKR
jgi:hypothetical protein